MFEQISSCYVDYRNNVLQVPLHEEQIRVLDGSRQKNGKLKMSFHVVIADGYVFDGADGDMHLIGEAFKSYALQHIPQLAAYTQSDGRNNVIDSVWDRDRNIRAPFAIKATDVSNAVSNSASCLLYTSPSPRD